MDPHGLKGLLISTSSIGLGIDAVSASEGACVLSAAVVSSGPEEAQPVSWLRARPAARLKEIRYVLFSPGSSPVIIVVHF